MATFTDVHRVLLQALMSRRAVPEGVAIELHKRAYTAVKDREPTFSNPKAQLRETLEEITQGVSDFDLEIRRSAEQNDSGIFWICLVNNRSLDDANEISAAVSDLTPLEISFYRQTVLQIIDSYPANSIGSKQALQIAGKLQTPVPKTTAESLLQALVSRGWLDKSTRGRYSLGVRANLELDQWLRRTYDDPDAGESILNSCSFNKGRPKPCKDLVLTGWKCEQPDCGAHLHYHCKAKLLAAKKKRCPACDASFDLRDGIAMSPIGEDAVPVEEDGRADVSRRGTKRSTAANGNGEDSDLEANGTLEGSDDEDEVATQGRTRGRASRRIAAQTNEEDEVEDSQ